MSRNKGKRSKNNNNNKNNDEDRIVEQWKIRKLIKKLSEARGNGTSMISLIIPPSGQISHVNNMLMQEHGTASNIKSRVNRLSVLSAITSTRERLKLYHRLPPNGLVLYCGTVITDEGKEKKMSIHFEPFKPVTTSLYLCDNKFHVEHLQSLLEEDSVFGFIIVDGNGCLFGTLSGNHCQVKQKFSVELPKKHGRGGQSAVRFARLRMEARHNYVRKCAEMATMNFITGDRANVEGIVLAGSASFKHQLNKSDLFDLRLKQIVIKVVDTSYGGQNGFNQAIELSKESLADVKFVHEKKVLADFLQEIAMDTDKYAFGIRDTMRALEMSAVKTIIVWDDLELIRYKLRNPSTKETKEVYIDKEEAEDNSFLKDDKTGVLWDVIEQHEVLEWMAENYKKFGTSLEFVTDRSPEGAQFVKGFGGIGAFLRWKINWADIDDYFEIDEEDDEAWI